MLPLSSPTDNAANANAESLEEVLDVLAEEGSDWLFGFFTFLYDAVPPTPLEREEEAEKEVEEEK